MEKEARAAVSAMVTDGGMVERRVTVVNISNPLNIPRSQWLSRISHSVFVMVCNPDIYRGTV